MAEQTMRHQTADYQGAGDPTTGDQTAGDPNGSALELFALRPQFLKFSPGNLDSLRVFFAPGRVNLIGEHTDYNGGFVLPAALELGTWVFVRERTDGKFRFAATQFSPVVEAPTGSFEYSEADDYANYPKGVLWVLQQHQLRIPTGADLMFHGNLPTGAGLSSSASIEVATGFAMTRMVSENTGKSEIAKLAQQAENQFVGVQCGIMDQFAVAMGEKGHALSLDCATLEYSLVPLPADGYQLVIANTNKRRGLADSKYNERRAECEDALRQVRQVNPGLQSLADIPLADWGMYEPHLSGVVLRRARHVVSENHRAKYAPTPLREGNLEGFGQLMKESHLSLRDDYEVTGLELDALAQAAWTVEGCYGSRMTGAGFGGCTVSLVRSDAVSRFQEQVQAEYRRATGLTASFYVSGLGSGVREVTGEVLQLWQS